MRSWVVVLAVMLGGCASMSRAPTVHESQSALTAAGGTCLNVTFDCPSGACNVVVNNPVLDAGAPDAAVVDASTPVDATVPDAAKDAAVADAATPPTPDASTPGQATRPAASKGVGFFTVGSKLYDANGQEFVMRGINRVHWDSNSPGIAATGANTQRWIVDFSRAPAANLTLMQQDVAQRRVTVPGNWDGTCENDPAILARIVDTWVAQAASWNTLERWSVINIANEFGPPAGNSTVWRDSYSTAVQRMRAAGYHGTLMVDAPGCGQDPDAIPKHGAAVLAADPEHNLVFSQHIYGFYGDPAYPGQDWSQTTLTSQVARLKATGLPIVFGELGPGRNIGPSPTTMPPEFVIQQANGAGFGWLGWAWDDGSATGRDDGWFAMSRDGTYTKSADLTMFGVTAVESALGTKATAKKATVFP